MISLPKRCKLKDKNDMELPSESEEEKEEELGQADAVQTRVRSVISLTSDET